MNAGGNAPVSSPPPVAGRPANSRATSAVAAVSVALILLYIFWRFVWQSKKHASTNDGLGAASSTAPRPSSSSCPSGAVSGGASVDAERGEDGRSPLPVFVHVATPGAAGAEEKVECPVCLVEFAHGEAGRLVPGCGHGFHAACIETWFQVRSTCPSAVPRWWTSGAPDRLRGWSAVDHFRVAQCNTRCIRQWNSAKDAQWNTRCVHIPFH